MLRGVPSALTDDLTAICGAERVVTHADALRTYESDGLLQYRALPRAVVLPDTAEQVQRVVRLCHERGGPWGARGAGSGVSGGAPAGGEGGVVVARGGRR